MKAANLDHNQKVALALPALCGAAVMLVLLCAPVLASSLTVQPLDNCTSHCCICYGPGRSTSCEDEPPNSAPDCACPSSEGDEDACTQNIPAGVRY